jgi:hypothetical protein
MKIIITKRQLNLINEQAGISKSEQRAQNAYKLMIDGSSGWGSKPNLIVQGINSLTKYDEFHRMNTLFSDGKTGYKSFDEMINGEFEYSNIKQLDNSPQFDAITKKLKSLDVSNSVSYSRFTNWPILKINNTKQIDRLTDLPKEPKQMSYESNIEPKGIKISESCKRNWNSKLEYSKNWLKDWLGWDETREKFINNYKDTKNFDAYEIKTIFDNYNNIITRTQLGFYDERVKTIDGYKLTSSDIDHAGAFAYSTTQKVYVNCKVDNQHTDEYRFDALIHELQHLLYFYFPLSPDNKINDVFSSKSKSNKKSNTINAQAIVNNKNEFNVNLNWLDEYIKYLDETQGKDYACDESEKLSNLYSVRRLFNVKAYTNLTKNMFIPYINNEKSNTNVSLLLSCWAKQGYKDFNTFINGLNSLAYQSDKKNQDKV